MLFIQFTTNFKNEDQHENWTTHTLGKMVLDTLPENALFLSIGDVYTNSVRYLQFCENYRTDVKVMDRELMKKPWFNNLVKVHYPELNIPGEKFRPGSLGDDKNYHLKMLLDANTSRFPVYGANFKKDSPENNDRRWQKAYYRLPYGTIHRFFKRSDTLDLNKYLSDSEHILAQIKLLKFQKVTEGNWEYLIWKDFQNAGYFRGRQLLYLAQKDRNQVLINQAIPMLEEVSKNHPEPTWENFKILGAAYNWRKKKTIGETKKMLSAWDRYFELSPHDDKDRVEIERSYSVYKKKLAEELAKRSDSKSNSKKSIILN